MKKFYQLFKILGLNFDDGLHSFDSLRYGKVLIMTDQDYDGFHIRGLLINFFHFFWPNLIHSNQFIQHFITPIVKISKENEKISFFNYKDYEIWKNDHLHQFKYWKVKYYKGLGTNTSLEAKEYFKNLDKHIMNLIYSGPDDDDLIDMLFSSQRSEDRKNWIMSMKVSYFLIFFAKTSIIFIYIIKFTFTC